MLKVTYQLVTGKYTLVVLSDFFPYHWTGHEVLIEGKSYQTKIVYDLPKSIAIFGTGDFVGKEIAFV